MTETRKLAVVLFEDVELLDFCGPFEVFSIASRLCSNGPAFDVYSVAQTSGPVRSHNGLVTVPRFGAADCPQPQILLVPGGIGTRAAIKDPQMVEWIGELAEKSELVLSVCTGALLLAKAGLLEGLEATTHHVAYELLEELTPTTKVHRDRRFVDNGRVITSAGIAAGIDMSFHVVARLLGSDLAAATAHHMEYPWQDGASVPRNG